MGRKPKVNKIEPYKPLLIKFQGGDNFDELDKNLDLKNIIYKETSDALTYAIKKKKAKIDLFVVDGYNLMVSVKKAKYNSVLDKTIEFYTKQENFEKCSELTKLKDEL